MEKERKEVLTMNNKFCKLFCFSFEKNFLTAAYNSFHLDLFIGTQGPRSGRGFNELNQEVQHHQGGWGHYLDHPPCSDKSQNLGFLRKSIFCVFGGTK